MENKEKLEQKILWDLSNYFHVNGIPNEKASKIIYEFSFLRLLSLKTFKNIIGHNDITLEKFISEYSIRLDNEVTQDLVEKLYNKEEYEILFNNFEKNIFLAREVLNDLSNNMYQSINVFPILSIMCSYNGIAIKNIMSLDLFNNSRFVEQTPEQICNIVNYVLDIGNDDTVLDICSGTGNFLVNVVKCSSFENLTGIEINHNNSLINKIRLAVLTNKDFEVIENNLFHMENFTKFDKIFCHYPWGVRYDNYEFDQLIRLNDSMKFKWNKINKSSIDWMFINALLTRLYENGKGAAIMTGGPLFKVIDKDYRKDIVDNGLVEAIIKLPVVTTYTNIDQYLVIFSYNNANIKFIDLSNELEKNRNRNQVNMKNVFNILNDDNSKKTAIISNSVIAENDYLLLVDNYIGKKEIKYYNPITLSDCVLDVFRGYQMTSTEQKELENENGVYEILMISDIENGIISNELARISNSETTKYDRYLLKENDLIISSKGTRIKIAVVGNIEDRKIIANGNLIVLRLDTTKLNPYYLEMYLNSEDGQTILNQIQTGSVIISINPRRLVEIQISSVDIKKQNELAEKYKIKQQQYLAAKEHLKKIEEEQNNFFDDMVVGLFDDER